MDINSAPQYRTNVNNQFRMKQDYIFAYSFSDGFTKYLFNCDLLIENSGKAYLYYSGFQLGNKYEILENIPEPIWEFLKYLDLNPLPEDYYSFDYGLYLSDIGSQQVFINWNKRLYYFFIEGVENINFEVETEWKIKFSELQRFLLDFAKQKRKELIPEN